MPPYHGGLFTLLAGARGAQLEGRRLHAEDERQRQAEAATANRAALELALRQRAEQRAEQAQQLQQQRFEYESTRPAPPRNIDPLSPEGIQAAAERAKALAPYQRSRRTGGGSETPAPSKLTVREQQGLAFLTEPIADPAVKARAEQLWRQYRRAMPNAHPGDVAAQVKAKLDEEARTARPSGDALDRFMEGQGGVPASAPAPAHTPGSTGNIDLRAAPTAPQALKPVPAADLEKARQDPSFAAWLRARGYAVPEAP